MINPKNSQTKTIWVISDCHFYHENVIKYCNRPFSSVKKMNNFMINKWNKVVGENDIVYYLGDFALGYHGKDEIKKIIKALHGKIYLITGNHDARNSQYYLDVGFAKVYHLPVLYDYNVVLKHTPVLGKENVQGMYYIFGHNHTKDDETERLNNCFNVAADRLNFKPIKLDEVIEALKSGRKFEYMKKMGIKDSKDFKNKAN